MSRRLIAAFFTASALLFAGCGVEEVVTEGETEGIWVDVGPLDYHIQGSRILIPGQVPDASYLKGVPETVEQPTGDEVWFAVWLRIENKTDQTAVSAEDFEIEDTEQNIYKPIAVDPEVNPFTYEPVELTPNAVIPVPDSAQDTNAVAGAQLLFKIPLDSYANRPLEFNIKSPDGSTPEEAQVTLDV